MHVKVNADRCQGHTMCAIAAPGVFVLDDEDGHAHVASPAVAPSSESNVQAAADTCPERAIEVWD